MVDFPMVTCEVVGPEAGSPDELLTRVVSRLGRPGTTDPGGSRKPRRDRGSLRRLERRDFGWAP